MAEDRARKLKVDTLEQWAELKTRKAVLDAVFDKWRDLFTRAAIQLESKTGPASADLKALPPGPDVDAAMAEYRAANETLVKLKAQLQELGLRVE